MNAKRTAMLTVLAVAGTLCLSALRPAQDDAVLADLLGKMKTAATEDRSSYMLTVQTATMAGAAGTEIIGEMWTCDQQHYRMEDSRGTVIVATPEGSDPVSMAIEMTVPEIEFDIEVPDETFEYEPPEGTEVVVWTPDKEAEDLGPVFGRAFGTAQD